MSLATAPIRYVDQSLPARLQGFATLPLTRALLAFTWLGSIRTVVPAVVLIVGWLLLRHRSRSATLLGGSIFGALILNELLKLIFHRPRPGLPWSFAGLAAPPEHTFSYPSGHAFFATVLYGMLACLALQRRRSWPKAAGVLAFAIFMPLAIGLSRIYFGMHNPTDVLAGYIAGSVWLAAMIMADRAILAPDSSAHRSRPILQPPARTGPPGPL